MTTLEEVLFIVLVSLSLLILMALLIIQVERAAIELSSVGFRRWPYEVAIASAFGLSIALIAAGIAGDFNSLTTGLGIYSGLCMLLWRDTRQAFPRKRRRARQLADATAEGGPPRHGAD